VPEVKTRYGVLTVPDVRTDVIGRFLEHYGEWAWDEVRFVASVLPENASILDVGAFLGTFGLGVSAYAELRRICFVEANSAVTPALKGNIQRNARVPSAVYEALVRGVDDPLGAGHTDPGNLGSTTFVRPTTCDSSVAPPAARFTLGELNRKEGPFDLIKLDVEGMEADILRAGADVLLAGETAVWVECNEDARSIAVAELLLSWGLDVHYFAFPAHNPDNFRGAAEPIFPMAYEAGLLAGARTVPTLDETLHAHGCILQPVWSSERLREIMWRTPRWGMAEWHGEPLAHLAALAGHTLRGDNFANYLAPGWASSDMLWQRVERLQQALDADRRHFQEEKQALQATLDSEQQRCASAEAALKVVTDEAKEACGQAHAQQHRAEVQAFEAEQRLKSEVRRCKEAEEALGEAMSLALDRLATMGLLREELTGMREMAELTCRTEMVRHAEAQANSESEMRRLQIELDAIRHSATWRLARSVHHVIESAPPIRRILSRSRRMAGRLARRAYPSRG
jgi:FkbM family methyltransferase